MEENPKKVSETHRIVWLDAYIGHDNELHAFKRRFVTSVEPDARYGNPLDIATCTLSENACPFIFTHDPDEALRIFESNREKRIIFISSGSMGVRIVPRIHPHLHNVYSFYIFCALQESYLDLVLDYSHCLQIFIHELDLLVRLMRDIAPEIIATGRGYEAIGKFQDALDCLTRARNLYSTANLQDTLHPPILTQLQELEGPDGRTGSMGILRDRILQSGQQPLPTPYYLQNREPRTDRTDSTDDTAQDDKQPTEAATTSEDLNMNPPASSSVHTDHDSDDDSSCGVAEEADDTV